MRQALTHTITLFDRLATEVAAKYQFTYLAEKLNAVRQRIEAL
jgi:hypothetical protein